MSKKKVAPGKHGDVFAWTNQRFGLAPGHSTYDPTDYSGRPLTYSGDPVQSDVPPVLKQVNSIQELKALIGREDDSPDGHIAYPEPYPDGHDQYIKMAETQEQLWDIMSNTVARNIQTAVRAYLYGNSAKVKKYETFLNALIFPMNVAYFSSATDRIINSDVLVTGPTPVVWNYNAITFQSGGNIKADTEFSITCNTMQKLDA